MVFMIFRRASRRCRVLEDFQEYFSLINFFLKSEELQTFPLRWRGVNVNFREAGIFHRIINCV